MSNIALIFAGGKGTRMHNATPKQFLLIMNKPILAYTIDIFEKCKFIDKILIVTLSDKIALTNKIIKKFKYKKIIGIVSGGKLPLDSQYNGLKWLKDNNLVNSNDIVLIHDGVRPLIDKETIIKSIKLAKSKGNAITISPASETISFNTNNNQINTIEPRELCSIIRAPQVFVFNDIYKAHSRAKKDKLKFIDSASMMKHYNKTLFTLIGPVENIKVTTENDFIVCSYLLKKKKYD